MKYLQVIPNRFAGLKHLKLFIIAAMLVAGLTAGFAAQASASGCNDKYVQISSNVPGRYVNLVRYDMDCQAVSGYSQWVAPGGRSAAGAVSFDVRPGERVGYRSLATGRDYITPCGGNNFGVEPIGNSVVLTGYIRC